LVVFNGSLPVSTVLSFIVPDEVWIDMAVSIIPNIKVRTNKFRNVFEVFEHNLFPFILIFIENVYVFNTVISTSHYAKNRYLNAYTFLTHNLHIQNLRIYKMMLQLFTSCKFQMSSM